MTIKNEQFIQELCDEYEDATFEYCFYNHNDPKGSADCTFQYEMDRYFDNEALVTFKKNSNEIIEFTQELIKNDNILDCMENFGEESGSDCDRLWIWW